MAVYTFLDLAAETLLSCGKEMTVEQIWDAAVKGGIDAKLRKKGQTPWATLGSRLYVDVKDNPASIFSRKPGSKPAEFLLKNPVMAKAALDRLFAALAVEPLKNSNYDAETPLPDPVPPKAGKYPYKERDLHPWLARFAMYGLGGVYAKTIFHENSSKKSYAEWIHPDLVGFWFPFSD